MSRYALRPTKYRCLILSLTLALACSEAQADAFSSEMERAKKDFESQVIQTSIMQFAPNHWGADRNWYVYKNGQCAKPDLDPAVRLMTALASGDFAGIDLDGKTDEDGNIQLRALVTVRDAKLQAKQMEFFYTNIVRCKAERGKAS